MSVKLLTEHLLEVLSLKGGCTGSSKSTLVKLSGNLISIRCQKEILYNQGIDHLQQIDCRVKSDNFGHQVNSDSDLV